MLRVVPGALTSFKYVLIVTKCKLTESKRTSQASDDSNSILGVCTELKQHRGEGIPLTLQLERRKTSSAHSNKLFSSGLHAQYITTRGQHICVFNVHDVYFLLL